MKTIRQIGALNMRFERLMSLKIRLLNCAKENGF